MDFIQLRKFIFFYGFILSNSITGQNLVPNPGFEEFDKCPDNYLVTDRKFLVPGWYIPTGSTPDYFNSCTRKQVGVPQNYMGYCLPKDGQGYAGMILLFNPPADSLAPAKENYREYIEAKLISPLEKGQLYKVSFFYNIATYSTYAINRLGIYFSEEIILKKLSKALPYIGILKYKPQIVMDSSLIITERDNWHEVTGTYLAVGGEEYITIGNFYNDRGTKYKIMDSSDLSTFLQNKIRKNKLAYYYVDMVSVCKMED